MNRVPARNDRGTEFSGGERDGSALEGMVPIVSPLPGLLFIPGSIQGDLLLAIYPGAASLVTKIRPMGCCPGTLSVRYRATRHERTVRDNDPCLFWKGSNDPPAGTGNIALHRFRRSFQEFLEMLHVFFGTTFLIAGAAEFLAF